MAQGSALSLLWHRFDPWPQDLPHAVGVGEKIDSSTVRARRRVPSHFKVSASIQVTWWGRRAEMCVWVCVWVWVCG